MFKNTLLLTSIAFVASLFLSPFSVAHVSKSHNSFLSGGTSTQVPIEKKLERLINEAETNLSSLKKMKASRADTQFVEKHLKEAKTSLETNNPRESMQHILHAFAKIKVIRARTKKA